VDPLRFPGHSAAADQDSADSFQFHLPWITPVQE
jgi:hypothetical protein